MVVTSPKCETCQKWHKEKPRQKGPGDMNIDLTYWRRDVRLFVRDVAALLGFRRYRRPVIYRIPPSAR